MRKEIIAKSQEELENLAGEFNLEDGGMNGRHVGMYWLFDDTAEVDVYYDASTLA